MVHDNIYNVKSKDICTNIRANFFFLFLLIRNNREKNKI